MRALRLSVRTPEGKLVDRAVRSIRAEDEDGWVGILPGRSDLVLLLSPSLVIFAADEGESYVAISGGLLDLSGDQCRVMAHDARLAREPAAAAAALEELVRLRRERSARQRGVLEDLEREAMRRVALAVRERTA